MAGGIGAAGNFTTEVKPGGAPLSDGGGDLSVISPVEAQTLPVNTDTPSNSIASQSQPTQQTTPYQPQYQQPLQQQQPNQQYQSNMGLQNLYNMFMGAMQSGGLQNLYGAGMFNRPRAPMQPMQPYVGSTYRPDMTSAMAKLNDVAPSVATEQARAAAEEARQSALSVLNPPQNSSWGD